MNRSGSGNALADPSRLKPVGGERSDTIKVVIETPKGSRNKYAFDEAERVFMLKKVLPVGMSFPYDFGFVPSTKAGDGDPTDVLVLMDEPAFPGCVLECRLIGVIEGKQGKGEKMERNDRVIAVQLGNNAWDGVNHVNDLGKNFKKELQQFFVNYNALAGKEYRVLGIKGPAAARKCVSAGMSAKSR
jgi:inorganic pyrophosphatase